MRRSRLKVYTTAFGGANPEWGCSQGNFPEQLTCGRTETDMVEPFRFRVHFNDYGAGIWIEFYRSHWWLALTGQAAHNYPKS